MRSEIIAGIFLSSFLVDSVAFSIPNSFFTVHNPRQCDSATSSSSNLLCQALQEEENENKTGAWIPVGSTSALKTLSPSTIEIMGEKFVVWNNSRSKKWSVLLDMCPHRLVPLSQGRINGDTGCIECGYHGWQFENDGSVSFVPQLDKGKKVENIPSATSFSVHETGDLLWVFLPSSFHGESFPKSLLPEDYYGASLKMDMARKATYYVDTLPVSFHMTVENSLDPAHFSFAHCGVIARREDAAPMPDMKVLTSNFTHLEVYTTYKRKGEPRERIYSFQRPSLIYTQEVRTDFTGESSWVPGSIFFLVPIREGQTRIITSVEKLTKSYLPDWITHLATRRLLVGDYIIHQGEINRRKRRIKYVEPSNCDTGSRAWNQWMKNFGFCNAPPHSFGLASESNLVPLTMEDLQNPWRSHTSTCSKCRTVLKRARRVQFWSLVFGIVGGLLLRDRKHPIMAALVVSVGIAVHQLSKTISRLMEGSSHRSDVMDRSYSVAV